MTYDLKSRLLAAALAFIMALTMMPILTEVVSASEGETITGSEIATWSGWRKSAASFTFEDSAPSHYNDVGPLFDKHGYKATFYVVTNWVDDWSKFGDMAKNGHEIGSHSDTHPQWISLEEVSGSKKNIEKKIQQKFGCITLAYPNGNVDQRNEIIKNYIAARIYDFSGKSIMGKDGPEKWTEIPAVTTGSQSRFNDPGAFANKLQETVDAKGWVVFATWGITNRNNGNANYSPTDLESINAALSWANERDGDIWVAPLRDVAMYIKERNASTLALKDSKSKCVSYTLTHDIADIVSNYDYPLSIRVPVPEGWTEVADVTQNEAKLEYQIRDGMIYTDAVPNAGEIAITRPEYVPAQGDQDPATPGVAPVNGESAQKVKANTLKVKGKTVTVRGAAKGNKGKLKKTRTFKITKAVAFANKGQGAKTYRLVSAHKGKKSFKNKFRINGKTGQVTVKKGLPKGAYKVKVKIRAAGSAKYNAATRTVIIKVIVR